MELLILLGVAIVVVIFVLASKGKADEINESPFRRSPSGHAAPPAFLSRETLLTPCELNFFRVLTQSVPEHVWINSKVRLADVLKTKNPKDKSSLNKICAKHLDFVLCDRHTSKIICAIELNDSSHNSFERSIRDGLVEEWLRAAGIRLVPIKASASYKPEEVRKLLGLQPVDAAPAMDSDAKYKPRAVG